MMKWKLSDFFEGSALVSLDVENGNQAAVLKFSGDPEMVEEARSLFQLATGVFGHLITDADEPVTGFDADYLLRESGLGVDVVEGAELLAKGYDAEIPEDALS